MKKYFVLLILISLFLSCSSSFYKVLEYSEFDDENDSFKTKVKPTDHYYEIRNRNYYYHTADSVLHFSRVYYQGVVDGYDRTLVNTDNGQKLYLDAIVSNGYYNNDNVMVYVIEVASNKILFCFVLDWKNKLTKLPKEK